MGGAFVVPGVSGGALAAIFGLYERIILFLAGITRDFNVKRIFFDGLFFVPVGIGGGIGLFAFAVAFSFVFEVAETQIIWLFIGFIAGTLPTLWKQAGQNGRGRKEISGLVIATVGGVAALLFVENFSGAIALNTFTWLMAGAIMSFGMIIPGLSSTSLLIFLDMYHPMTIAISSFDFAVLIPLGLGCVAAFFAFSRLIAIIIEAAYGVFFHVIIGLVVASTLFIIPTDYDYMSFGGLISLVTFFVGDLSSSAMCRLEKSQNRKIS